MSAATVGFRYYRRRKAVAEVHQKIATALRRHDGPSAGEAMRQHVSEAGAYWQQKYPDLYGRPVRWLS